MIRGGYDNIIMIEGICIHQALEKSWPGEDDDDDVLMNDDSSCRIGVIRIALLRSVASLSLHFHEMKHDVTARCMQRNGNVPEKSRER